MKADDHYVVITADSHAGGSHAQYREYLDPKYRDDFDAWREKYKNPFKDLKDTDLRMRNWDGELPRPAAERRRHRRRGDLPQHGAAVLPELRAVRRSRRRPDEYEHRHAGIQAHNRWLADYCAAEARGPRRHRPDLPQRPRRRHRRRAVVQGERPARRRARRVDPPITCDWLKPLYDPYYDPLWAACEELGVPVNAHSGTGGPTYQRAPAMPIVHIAEMIFYSQRPFVYLIIGGVFERFPNLEVRAHRSRLRVGPRRARAARRR